MEVSQAKLLMEQDKKIKMYEQKLRDLIEAYKTLTKEKEAMNCTVKSLLVMNNKKEKNEDAEDDDNKQILMLSNAISTMSEEKRKLERNYLEEKKLMRTEYELNLSSLKKELESQSIIIKELNGQLGEKNKLCQQKIDELTLEKNDLAANLAMKESVISRLNEECSGIKLFQNDWSHEMTIMKNGYESRLSLLEESITQLSETVNQLEHQHAIDQETIEKLHLDRRSANNSCRSQLESTPDILQFQDVSISFLSDKMLRTGDLKNVTIDNENPSVMKCSGNCQSKIDELRKQVESLSPIALLLDGGFDSVDMKSHPDHGQSNRSEDSHDDIDNNDEMDRLRNDLSLAQLRVNELQEEISSIDAGTNKNMKTMKETILSSEWRHKQELAKLQQSHNATVQELQSELTKHRNRTIDLIADKDSEIRSLQKQLQINHRFESDTKPSSDTEPESTDVWVGGGSLSSCPLYQCCEMKARMNRELKRLRHANRELVTDNHRLESEVQYVRSDWASEVDTLTKRVQRAEAINKLSAGVNLEYLRNVLMQFIGTSDPSSKYLMAKAIGKVLQFSSEELASLRKL